MVGLWSEARQRQAPIHVRRADNIRVFFRTLTTKLVDAPSVDRAFLPRVVSFDEKLGGESQFCNCAPEDYRESARRLADLINTRAENGQATGPV
jgi:hypothetical protein